MDKKIEAHFFLGYTCNSHCKHCVVQVKREKIEKGYSDKDLTTEQAFEHLRYLVDKDVYEVVLSGGEPTMRSDIVDLVSFLLDNNIKVQVQTNGSNPEIVKKIVEANIDKKNDISFMIPLHSIDKEEHNFISRNLGGFDKTLKSLELLKQYNIYVIGKIVLTRLTGKLKDIIYLYKSNNVKDIIIAYPHCVSFNDEKVKEIDLKLEEVEEKLKSIGGIVDDNNIILQGIPYCRVNSMYNHIQEDDFQYLDKEIIEYKYKDEYEYPWHIYRKKDKRKFSKCNSCEYNDKCEGIWKEYIRTYGDE